MGDSECGTDLSEHYHMHKHNEPLLSDSRRLNPLDSGGETEYKYKSSESYLRHPNSYLPHYNIQTDTDSEHQPLNGSITTPIVIGGNKKNKNGALGILASDDELENNDDEGEDDEDQDLDDDDEDDNVVPYGFPSARSRNRCARATDLVITNLDERNSLLGNNGTANSNSDLSTHLCEIDDADFEIAQQKSNGRAWHIGGVTQTSV